MKIIGESAKSIRWLIVGGESLHHPEFFETGFNNFGKSLEVFTLKNDCFKNTFDFQDDMRVHDYVNNLDKFFKSLNKHCPKLSILNLGSAHQLRCVHTNNQWNYEKLFSMAGFEMVKELNVDFTFFLDPFEPGSANFNWFFGLINDCNSIETLRLNGLTFPFFGKSSSDMASIKEKFKNLKKCQISFQEGFEPYFKNISSGYAGLSWRQYAAE